MKRNPFSIKKTSLALLFATFLVINLNCKRSNISEAEDYTKYVNVFIGTGTHGHTYPGAVVPFGMVQLSPDTDTEDWDWCGGYHYSDSSIIGFSHTHISGTGLGDLGDILVMATTGVTKTEPGDKKNPDTGYRSRFSHKDETATPGYYSVILKDYNIKAELTATKRVGFHRYTFPKADSSHILIDLHHIIYSHRNNILWAQLRVENDSLITGYRIVNGWAKTRYIYFAAQFSKPFSSYTVVNKLDKSLIRRERNLKDTLNIRKNWPEAFGNDVKIFVNYQTSQNEAILVKVAISAVSTEGAINNLKEISGWDFDKVKNDAKQEWNKELSKIQVEADEKTKEIFYTSMYHSMLAPVLYMDADNRYRGLDQNIHTAKDFENYHIFSLWDTYRAEHPLFTILHPERVSDMIKTMLAHYEQSPHKILPLWAFGNNETWTMIGYHSVPVIADAYLKGIRNFDVKKAFEAMKSSATYKPYKGLGYYMQYGYVPMDKEFEGASKTLEYAFDDWCIAQMAKSLGKEDDYKEFYKRSTYYKNIFDPVTGFMRAKNTDGTFKVPFDPAYSQYGGDYTEGNAWQYTWYVPQNVQDLINLMGGNEKFITKLDSLFIVQETENEDKPWDISGLIGQYAHGNEPSHHAAYLYNYAGAPWKTQEKIYQIMTTLYDNTPDGICGNDDCGQMSAWYIFSAMGFYPVNPCNSVYVIGTPMLNEAVINLTNGNKFKITAKGLSKENRYIQSAEFNGTAYDKSWISHKDIMSGGELVFIMGNKPNKKWASSKESVPPLECF